MTIQEVAKCLGISKGTIWRALNNAPDISPKTRERVLRQLNEVGYRPSRMAQALSTGRSQVVSVWMGSLTSPYANTVLYHLEQRLVKSSYDMLLRNLHYRSLEVDTFSFNADWPADGLIILDSIPWVNQARRQYQDSVLPLVNMGVYCDTSVDHVRIDLYQPVVKAMKHLLAEGCRKIAFLGPAQYFNKSQDRYRAYCDVVKKAGLEKICMQTTKDHRKNAMDVVAESLRNAMQFDAIMAFNDEHAIGAYRALLTHGVQVPRDVALVGCDGLEEIEYLEHQLSTISLPIPQMCELAWQFLLRRMREPDAPVQSSVLRPELIIRDSSRKSQKNN